MRTKNTEYFSKIIQCIDAFRLENGISPTIQEIADTVGMSKSNVARYLAELRSGGQINYASERRRNLMTPTAQKQKTKTVRVPVLGTVSCGIPKFAEECIECYVQLPTEIFGEGEFFLLRTNGDSMIEAGIDDGDLVLIRQQSTADIGQIVVALVEDEATLKRYYPEPEKQRIRLHPANAALKDIYVRSCIIQGVAVKVVKNLERFDIR